MARAYGSSAALLLKRETAYGTRATGNYIKMPFTSCNLGSEQGLIDDPVLGLGRDPSQPLLDVINDDGDIVVPVDPRYLGLWLTGIFGNPVSAGVAASGAITFATNPAANSTITLNSVVWTFVTGTPTGNQIQIGGSVTATIDAAVTALNASANTSITPATYSRPASSQILSIVYDTTGPAGNAYTQSPTMAQRIAMIALEQNRRQKEILFPCNLVGFQLAAGNTVAVNLPRMGLAGLPCTVTNWSVTEDLGVDLTLDEDGPDVYEFSVSDLQSLDAAPNVVVPNNASVPPSTPQNLDAEAGSDFIHLSWDPVTDSDLRYVEVWENETTTTTPETDASRIMEVSGNELTRTNLPGGTTRYYWIRSVDRYGNKSDFAGPVSATTSGDASIVLVLE